MRYSTHTRISRFPIAFSFCVVALVSKVYNSSVTLKKKLAGKLTFIKPIGTILALREILFAVCLWWLLVIICGGELINPVKHHFWGASHLSNPNFSSPPPLPQKFFIHLSVAFIQGTGHNKIVSWIKAPLYITSYRFRPWVKAWGMPLRCKQSICKL